MKVSVEEVTPMVAEMLLQKNTNNYRKLSQPTVTKYANKMRQGEWDASACMIQIDTNDVLLNGQHRLHAVMQSGETIQSIIVTGASPDSRYRIDSHMPRRMKDHCECEAYKITMINTFLRSEGLFWDYKDNVQFYRGHVIGDIGTLSEKLYNVFSKTYSPFTSVGFRAGLILGILNNQLSEAKALELFEQISNLRKKPKQKDQVTDYMYNISTRGAIMSKLDPLMVTLVDHLDRDKLPVQSPVANSNSWYTESYDGAREKASKLMKATYLAICKDTKNNTKFKGALTTQVTQALGI
tara:strand:- start:193 stop:1080 length:888 start_codon:yes stop_codon:yes gene_type:complete